jgi:hypothetical protein
MRHIVPLLQAATAWTVAADAVCIAISQDHGIHIDGTPHLLCLNHSTFSLFDHLPACRIVQHSLRTCCLLLSDPPLQTVVLVL